MSPASVLANPPQTTEELLRPSWRGALILGALLGAAGFLRFYALSWGMPLKHAHIDESVVVFYALRVLAGDPNPQVFFDYPAFFLYVLNAVFHAAVFFAQLAGSVRDLPQALEMYLSGNPSLFTLSARMTSAAASIISVALVYRIGTRCGNRFMGVASAALLAVNRLHVLHAHYGTVDSFAVMLSLLALSSIISYWTSGDLRVALWAAFWTGLATATKYYPAILGVLLLATPLVRRDSRQIRTVGILVLIGFAGFFLGSPYSILSWTRSWERILHLFPKIIGNPGGGGPTPILPTLMNIWRNSGSATVLFALAGFTDFFREFRQEGRPVLSPWTLLSIALILLIGFFGLWSSQAEHYALLAYPLIFIFAARGIWMLRRWNRYLPAASAIALVAICLLPTLHQLDVLSKPDSRLIALTIAREKIPAGSRILRSAHTPEFTAEDPFHVSVDWENKRFEQWRVWKEAGGTGQNPLHGYNFLVYSTYDPSTDLIIQELVRSFRVTDKVELPSRRFPHNPVIYFFASEEEGKS